VLSLIARAPYRIGQLGRALAPWVAARDRALAEAMLTPAQLAAFQLMSPTDQRHAARVARYLLDAGLRDPDLLVAALLHDVGKVDPAALGRVRLSHRVTKVVLLKLVPGLWWRLSTQAGRGPFHGYYLLRYHPALGAAWAARLGVSERACALIAAHQDDVALPEVQGAGFRRLLHCLRDADDHS
jgi:hypothetical protein